MNMSAFSLKKANFNTLNVENQEEDRLVKRVVVQQLDRTKSLVSESP